MMDHERLKVHFFFLSLTDWMDVQIKLLIRQIESFAIVLCMLSFLLMPTAAVDETLVKCDTYLLTLKLTRWGRNIKKEKFSFFSALVSIKSMYRLICWWIMKMDEKGLENRIEYEVVVNLEIYEFGVVFFSIFSRLILQAQGDC